MRRKNGFTIVETSLVILLMVFIALPGVFRNQRDAERRDDVLLFLNKLKNFQANNNRGALPNGEGKITFGMSGDSNTWAGFYHDFFNNSFADPSSGEPYIWYVLSCGSTAGMCNYNVITSDSGEKYGLEKLNGDFDSNGFTMYIVKNAICDGEKAMYSANPRNVAVLYKLEGGGIFCANT